MFANFDIEHIERIMFSGGTDPEELISLISQLKDMIRRLQEDTEVIQYSSEEAKKILDRANIIREFTTIGTLHLSNSDDTNFNKKIKQFEKQEITPVTLEEFQNCLAEHARESIVSGETIEEYEVELQRLETLKDVFQDLTQLLKLI